MLTNEAVVIGGGPAGIMAAIAAARGGARVLLLEKNGLVGGKLPIAGGGRCNLTSGGEIEDFVTACHNGPFLRNCLHRFGNRALVAFFEDGGLPLVEERGRRVFPASQSARPVVEFLRRELGRQRVQLWFRQPVRALEKKGGVFHLDIRGQEITARKAVIATGGLSYPETGSTGDGYRLARRLGHTVHPPRPALCGIFLKEKWISRWQGISLRRVALSLDGDRAREFGDLVFTGQGISGPAVLNLSRRLTDLPGLDGRKLRLDFKPALDEAKLDRRLVRECAANSRLMLRNGLKALLPAAVIPQFVALAGLRGDRRLAELNREERRQLLRLLKGLPLTVRDLMPLETAIVTRGGVAVEEIEPRTMASRLVPGLYFAGELIDVDGKTGGYNLQAAFSTGHAAGEALAASR